MNDTLLALFHQLAGHQKLSKVLIINLFTSLQIVFCSPHKLHRLKKSNHKFLRCRALGEAQVCFPKKGNSWQLVTVRY